MAGSDPMPRTSSVTTGRQVDVGKRLVTCRRGGAMLAECSRLRWMSHAGRSASGGDPWWSGHGDPDVQTITGVSGFGANAPQVLQRAAKPIPDQLNSQLQLTLHPFDRSGRSRRCPISPPSSSDPPSDRNLGTLGRYEARRSRRGGPPD